MEVKTECERSFDTTGGVMFPFFGNGLIGAGGFYTRGINSWGNDFVTQEELCYAQEVDSLKSKLEKEMSERYTDKAVIKQAEKDAASDKELFKNLIDIGVGVTRLDQQIKANADKQVLRDQLINEKFSSLRKEFMAAIALESERRVNGDQGLYSFVKGNYVPGNMYMPATRVTPEPMPLNNSWTAPTA